MISMSIGINLIVSKKKIDFFNLLKPQNIKDILSDFFSISREVKKKKKTPS